MRFRHRLQPDAFTARATVQDTTMWMATCAAGYGLSLIVGGDPIWAGPAYDTARLLPASPESWGVALLVGALMVVGGMFTGRRRILLVGMWVGLLWNFFFALSFLSQFVQLRLDDHPGQPLGLGPFVTYLFISGLFALRISTYRGKNAAPPNTP